MEEQKSFQKRSVACKVSVSDILEGRYVKDEGSTPNFVSTKRGDVSRVNMVGVIVSKEEHPGFDMLLFDDSTGNIAVRSFENRGILKSPKVGQTVLLVGRPREYNNEKYILPEIVRPLDKNWFLARKKELLAFPKNDLEEKKTVQKISQKVEAVPRKDESVEARKEETAQSQKTNPYSVVLNLVKTMDEGFGVTYEDLMLTAKVDSCEEIIQSLIEEGEIFEIRPGVLKSL